MRRGAGMRARLLVVSAAMVGALALAPGASAATATLSGNCQFSGPITPQPPITLVPKTGSHFSYHATGSCSGTLDGAAVTSAPVTVAFDNVSTLFDTCELGPDFNLHGTLKAGSDTFGIVINLPRIALVGPFLLTTNGGGLAIGGATFSPPDALAALQQCAGSGVSTATLAANFSTLSALVGSAG
jgi:hypothetical protein